MVEQNEKQVSIYVSVPEAELVVEKLRLQFDPYRQRGVPAHITLVGPFDEPEYEGFREELRAFLLNTKLIDFSLTSVETFGQNDDLQVVYLAPDRAERFTKLREDICKRFGLVMDNKYPYVPHVTVGVNESVEGFGATTQQLHEIVTQLRQLGALPIVCCANEAVLMLETTEKDSFCVLERYKIDGRAY